MFNDIFHIVCVMLFIGAILVARWGVSLIREDNLINRTPLTVGASVPVRVPVQRRCGKCGYLFHSIGHRNSCHAT